MPHLPHSLADASGSVVNLQGLGYVKGAINEPTSECIGKMATTSLWPTSRTNAIVFAVPERIPEGKRFSRS